MRHNSNLLPISNSVVIRLRANHLARLGFRARNGRKKHRAAGERIKYNGTERGNTNSDHELARVWEEQRNDS